jgi:hypothetical protein
MKYSDKIRANELDKLKKSNYFDDEALQEIRQDIDQLNDNEIIKNEVIIEENTSKIVSSIPLNQIRSLRFSPLY